MSEKEKTQKSSSDIGPRMKDGEEPIEVLISLVSSPLIDLNNRGVTQILTATDEAGRPVVLAIFPGATWDSSVGIVLAEKEPTLEADPGVLAVEDSSVGSLEADPGVLAIGEDGLE
jgi:hypothetical protein